MDINNDLELWVSVSSSFFCRNVRLESALVSSIFSGRLSLWSLVDGICSYLMGNGLWSIVYGRLWSMVSGHLLSVVSGRLWSMVSGHLW